MPLTESVNLVLRNTSQPLDADAQAYVNAVEVADGQRIEDPVRFAINNFVIGCKADGIWSAIKASCILAGARTLSGALVPLAGTAPTNNNFVSGDYNRKTGLVGDGSTKYLNSNRNNNADPQDSKHLAVFVQTAQTSASGVYIGGGRFTDGASVIGSSPTDSWIFARCNNASLGTVAGASAATGFIGASRSGPSAHLVRVNSSNSTISNPSAVRVNANILVHARTDAGGNSADSFTNARLAFYSIGESLDLALLDARVTALINAIGAAIP